uniref:Uncharacterized protein n=1 Tax=Timema douglasi TaxID=61478 RepID=A0A7R8VIP8_TIMDO|nr:unnamed protein product [Timema douglasi]
MKELKITAITNIREVWVLILGQVSEIVTKRGKIQDNGTRKVYGHSINIASELLINSTMSHSINIASELLINSTMATASI